MSSSRSYIPSPYQALFRATVDEAVKGGSLLMGKLVAVARTKLQVREAASRDVRERDALAQSAKQLRSWEAELCRRFPQALSDAFSNPEAVRKVGVLSVADVAFDELELMDEVQVLTSVAMARTLQAAVLEAEVSLADLNTLICGTLGLAVVNPERNPLRPQTYVNALRAVVELTEVSAQTQLEWLGGMGVGLGQELRCMYLQLSSTLRGQGVTSVGYAVLQTPSGPGVGRGIAHDLRPSQANVPASQPPTALTPALRPGSGATGSPGSYVAATVSRVVRDDTLLTLDKLRRLLVGELDTHQPLSQKEQFAQNFTDEFERRVGPVEDTLTDFDATVPAALEALKEMEQVGDVLHRLQQRQRSTALPVLDGDTSIEALRVNLRSHARGVAQALSLEVITLMVDNIANDARLLTPVQQLIRRLEPALLRLALVDPRLFTNKQHPARVLVQEIAHHSLAYESPMSIGFVEFLGHVERAVAPLANVCIESAEPFEWVLKDLRTIWDKAAQASERSRVVAMQALKNAEQRNVLAEKIACEIVAHPDAAQVPDAVISFLYGPWAQVLAQARMAGKKGAGAAEKFEALISPMLWSTHPQRSRNDTTSLIRLMPQLLGTLREGLETIHYPATRTSAFLEVLLGLHQLAFRGAHKSPSSDTASALVPTASIAAVAAVRIHLVEDGNPWVAPEEAEASNFMDLPDATETPTNGSGGLPTDTDVSDGAVQESGQAANDLSITELPLGSWVELLTNGQWTRTQLSWASPHGTLFLFTSALGATQSMTRRSRDRLEATGQLRVISDRPMVDGALDAVAQMAMRNSINTLV